MVLYGKKRKDYSMKYQIVNLRGILVVQTFYITELDNHGYQRRGRFESRGFADFIALAKRVAQCRRATLICILSFVKI